jgi:hypothetical protein
MFSICNILLYEKIQQDAVDLFVFEKNQQNLYKVLYKYPHITYNKNSGSKRFNQKRKKKEKKCDGQIRASIARASRGGRSPESLWAVAGVWERWTVGNHGRQPSRIPGSAAKVRRGRRRPGSGEGSVGLGEEQGLAGLGEERAPPA